MSHAPSPSETALPTVLAVIHQDVAGLGSFAPLMAEAGYRVETTSFADGGEPALPLDAYAAVIVFGGSPQVDQEEAHPWLIAEKRLVEEIIERRQPLLGVCLGAQLIAEVAGGWVGPAQTRRRGWGEVELTEEAASDPIFIGGPKKFTTVVWHSYEFRLPPGATALARSSTALQAFRIDGAPIWAVQFHPEVERDGIAVWVEELARKPEAGVTEVEVERILADSVANEAGQMRLAELISGGFLREAAAAANSAR